MNLIVITYGIWFLSEIITKIFFSSKKTSKQRGGDKESFYLIWAMVFISIFISNTYDVPILKNHNFKYFGISLIYIGIILRLFVIKKLGRFFTVDVAIIKNHQLKKNGFYKYVRHPSYSASLLSFIGFGISLNSLIYLVLVSVLMLITVLIRIKIEEKILIQYFGSEYLEYKKNTKQIIPFIY